MKKEVVKNYKIDKSKWPKGEWSEEPDRVDFRSHGFPCLILRHERAGHFCGYVGVPPGHPLYRKGYDEIYATSIDGADLINVHGGLTYSRMCSGAVCHVPRKGEPSEVWWFGFDCAHCDDVSPAYPGLHTLIGDGEYRNVKYVRKECVQLAKQLKDIAKERGEK